jgi:hypothetical protein
LTTAHVSGVYDVVVTVDGVASTALADDNASDDYDYIDPMVITGVSPDVGAEGGGETVTITGGGFLSSHRLGEAVQPTVTFDYNGDPADCAVMSFTDTEIICATSAHAHGLVDVKVDNGRQSAALDDAYFYYEIYVGLASSQGSGKVSFSVLPSDANGGSGFDIITARTNLPTGYQLSMKTAANTLVCGGLDVCSSQWYSSVASLGTLSDGSWGYQLDYLANSADAGQADPDKPPPSDWQPIPVADTQIYDKSELSIGVTDVGGDTFRLWYGAKASWFLPVTTYQRQVTITAIANI